MGLNVGYLTAKTNKQSDEIYTPRYAVEPLEKFIPKHWKIWCPFDTEDSEYVKFFREKGYNVINSHITQNKDFFTYQPVDYDCIVSNPPFSLKDEIIQRLFELNKPYAILLPIPALQGQKRFPYIQNCEALIFDKRINYYCDKEKTKIQKGVSFGSFYLCYKILPRPLLFERLNI